MNWLAILVATLAAYIIGMLWYGPLFGKQWMKLTKSKKSDMKPAPRALIMAFIRMLVTAIILGWLLTPFQIADFGAAMLLGLMLWLGFIAAPALADVIWAKKPVMLWFMNVAYELISVIVMVAIIVVW